MGLKPIITSAPGVRARGDRFDCGGGLRLTAQQIAARTGCGLSAVYRRIDKGWAGEDLLRPRKEHLYDVGGGRRMTARDISARTGVSLGTVHGRLARGWRGAELLVRNQERRRRGEPRGPGQVIACKLALAFPDALPTVAQIRRVHPMSEASAQRWRCALRLARQQLHELGHD